MICQSFCYCCDLFSSYSNAKVKGYFWSANRTTVVDVTLCVYLWRQILLHDFTCHIHMYIYCLRICISIQMWLPTYEGHMSWLSIAEGESRYICIYTYIELYVS